MTISANTLTQFDLPPRPYYERQTYLQSDFREGVLKTESGRRVIILPQELVLGVHQAIEYETGRAWNLVANLCGRRWGERLLLTVREEWRHFHRTSMDHVEFDFFEEWLKGYFRFHGWGRLEMDFSMERQGLVEFRLYDSVLDRLLASLPGGYVNEIFTGLLASWISWFSGEELDCLEIASPHLGAECARLIVGTTPRIEAARRRRAAGGDLEAMMEVLMEKT